MPGKDCTFLQMTEVAPKRFVGGMQPLPQNYVLDRPTHKPRQHASEAQ